MSLSKETKSVNGKALVKETYAAVIRSEEDGSIAKNGLCTVCPHCGMVDHDNVNQSIQNTHWRNIRVGSISKYECGKCRKSFYTIELVVPAEETPEDFYEKVVCALKSEQHEPVVSQ